jgi:hypothetical protein
MTRGYPRVFFSAKQSRITRLGKKPTSTYSGLIK